MNYEIPRILHVFTIMNRGGAESMIMNYYRQLDRKMIQFDFLVHRQEKGAFDDEIEKMGGNIYRMPGINPLFPRKYYRCLNDFFKSHHYKVVHSHINSFSYFPLKIALKNNVLCRIAHSHTTNQFFTFMSVIKQPKVAAGIFFKNFQKKEILKYASHLIACGKLAGDWLFEKADYSILPNAIDSCLYKYDKTKAFEIRKKHNLDNMFVIGHIGNFSYPKNYPFMMNVFNFVKKHKTDSKLVLIGDGIMKEEIIKLAISMKLYNDVIFMGVRNDIPDLLQMMDIFIFPSFYEGFPVTLIEAQASGLKIIASNSISSEVKLTDDISFMSLEKSPDFWADQILKIWPYKRNDNTLIIKEKKYDIGENITRLEHFYLDQLNQINR